MYAIASYCFIVPNNFKLILISTVLYYSPSFQSEMFYEKTTAAMLISDIKYNVILQSK